MFNIPKRPGCKKDAEGKILQVAEKIKGGTIPSHHIKYVLDELGFKFLATIEYGQIEKDLLGSKDAITISELVDYLMKHIYDYTSKENLTTAVRFFDMDNSGKISPEELESMLNTFSKNEEEYLKPEEIKEIIRTDKKSMKGDQIGTDLLIENLWNTWKSK